MWTTAFIFLLQLTGSIKRRFRVCAAAATYSRKGALCDDYELRRGLT